MTIPKPAGIALAVGVIIVGVLTVLLSGGKVPAVTPSSERPGPDGSRIGTVADAEAMLSFDYRIAPDGYTVTMPPVSGEGAPVKAYTLMKTSDYEELRRSEVPREGPPSIEVRVYRPGPNVTPEEWAKRNPAQSNYAAGAASSWIRVDGNSALQYSWDGLYAGRSVVVARKGWVYVFSVAYLEQAMLDDFTALVQSADIQPQ